jgi:hypothetical protein
VHFVTDVFFFFMLAPSPLLLYALEYQLVHTAYLKAELGKRRAMWKGRAKRKGDIFWFW